MAVVQHKSADKTVATIPARNAISPRPDHMTVVVTDATGDPNVLSGKAVYKWDNASTTWILLSKETNDTLTFATENQTITADKVIADNVPSGGVIWDVFVVVSDSPKIISQVEWMITGPTISVLGDTAGEFDGKKLHFKYAYGSLGRQLADLGGNLPWANITNTPTTFPPSAHNHVASQITESATQVFVTPEEKTAITHSNRVALDAVTGTNTGDETLATIKTKLGVTTLSGSNTGDQIIPTTLPASDVSAWAKSATKPAYTKSEVGLASVDNTSDADKPVSTATQTALNLKANNTLDVILTANGTAVTGSRYIFNDNNLTLTLPASPVATNEVYIVNQNKTGCVINPGTAKINSTAGNMTVDINYAGWTMRYINATLGWVIS